MVEIQPEPRIAMIIRTSAWLGIAAHAGFIPLFWLTGYPVLAAFNVVSVPAWVVAWLLNRRRQSTLAMWLLTVECGGARSAGGGHSGLGQRLSVLPDPAHPVHDVQRPNRVVSAHAELN